MAKKSVSPHKKVSSPKDFQDFQTSRTKYINAMFALWMILNNGNPKVTEQINRKAEEWDKDHPKGHNYHDLHFMTKFGALDYVDRIVKRARQQSGKIVLRLETGRDNHSINNVPVIKNELLRLYSMAKDCTIRQDQRNPGVLILTVC